MGDFRNGKQKNTAKSRVNDSEKIYLFLGGMEGGIGLFWIVRIYLLMAAIAPVLVLVTKRFQSELKFLIMVLAFAAVNQLCYLFLWGQSAIGNFVLENFVMSTLGYSCVYMLGLRIKEKGRISILPSFISFVIITVITQLNSWGYIVSQYKYPPQIEYIAYGVAMSLLLFCIADLVQKKFGAKNCALITWISRNSFNIYLIHAVILKLLSWGNKYLEKIPYINNWLITYIIVVCSSCLIIKIIERLKDGVIK